MCLRRARWLSATPRVSIQEFTRTRETFLPGRQLSLPASHLACLLVHLLVLPHHQLTPDSDACVTSDEALSLPPWHPTSALSPPGAGSAPAGLNDLPAQPAVSLCRLRAPEKAVAAPHPAHCPASASGVTWHRAGTRRSPTVELAGMPARRALRRARANGATVPESDMAGAGGGGQAPQHCLSSPLSFPRKESKTAASSPTGLLSTPNAAGPKGDVLGA